MFDNESKNILYIVISFGIIIFSGIKLYYFLGDIRMQYYIVQKRKDMNNQYILDFKRVYLTYFNSRRLWVQDCQLSNTIKNLEDRMIYDGYSYAEISEIKLMGENKARACY